MAETSLRLWTGVAGIGAFVATLPVIALYFITTDPPPARTVLVRVLLNTLLCAALLVFVTGLSTLIYRTPGTHAWLAVVSLAAALVTAAFRGSASRGARRPPALVAIPAGCPVVRSWTSRISRLQARTRSALMALSFPFARWISAGSASALVALCRSIGVIAGQRDGLAQVR